jgi:hypothetical protein
MPRKKQRLHEVHSPYSEAGVGCRQCHRLAEEVNRLRRELEIAKKQLERFIMDESIDDVD